MEKLSAGGETIDRCIQCGGIFLDYFDGEPVAITKSIPAARVSMPGPQEASHAIELRKWVLEEFIKDHGYDLSKHTVAVDRIDKAVSQALDAYRSSGEARKINLPFIVSTADGHMHLVVDLAGKLDPSTPISTPLCSDCHSQMPLTPYLGDGPEVFRCGSCMSLFATPTQWEALARYEPTQEDTKRSPWWSRLRALILGSDVNSS